MKTLAILFTLISVCGAYADPHDYSLHDDYVLFLVEDVENLWYVTVDGAWAQSCPCCCDNYELDAQKDITAYELSIILRLIWGASVEDLTREEFKAVKRHLKCMD